VIFSQSGGYQGIGFAVSSNLAKRVFTDLRQFGEVRRGSLGYVEVIPLTPQIAQELATPDTQGLAVVRMARTASAYQAGLRLRDVIKSFNGTTLSDASQLSRMISDSTIGSTATLGILREGRAMTLKVPIQPPVTSTRQ
jgi:S1-C subfamily serine protease